MDNIESRKGVSIESKFENGREAFKESYETALAFRNLMRGHGEHGSESGVDHFSIQVPQLTDRAVNISEASLRDRVSPTKEQGEFFQDLITEIRVNMTKFETLEGIKLSLGHLDDIEKGFRSDDMFLVLKSAVALRSRLQGMEEMNEILLLPADQKTEDHNSSRK